jgi:hypothetical protein
MKTTIYKEVRHIGWYIVTNVSMASTASVIRVQDNSKHGKYTAMHIRTCNVALRKAQKLLTFEESFSKGIEPGYRSRYSD